MFKTPEAKLSICHANVNVGTKLCTQNQVNIFKSYSSSLQYFQHQTAVLLSATPPDETPKVPVAPR